MARLYLVRPGSACARRQVEPVGFHPPARPIQAESLPVTTPRPAETAVSMQKWLGGGLFTLAVLQTVASAWQYLFPRAFYNDFPTVRLDPPYNQHLVSDTGGLGLALAAMLYVAAVVLDHKIILSTLLGYLIYAATHFTYHVTHFDHFSLRDALGVGTGLGIEVVLALLLLYANRLAHRADRPA